VYRNLVIEASSPTTDIRLGDDDGHLVQKETGRLETSVREGRYTVEFDLDGLTYQYVYAPGIAPDSETPLPITMSGEVKVKV